MKRLKIMPKLLLGLLTLGAVSALLAGCTGEAGAAPVSNQTATVQRGTIAQEVTATGNLVASNKKSLSFDTAGTVAEVLVTEGQAVEKGEVLARLDTSPLQDQITSLERQLTKAQRQVTTAERQVTTAEQLVTSRERQVSDAEYQVTLAERKVATAKRQVTLAERQITLAERKVNDAVDQVTNAEEQVATAERQITARERDVVQAEMNLTSAQNDLEKALDNYSLTGRRDLISARTATLRKAQSYLEYAQKQLDMANNELDIRIWTNEVAVAQQQVAEAQARVDELLNTTESQDISIKRMQVDLAQGRLDDAKYAVPQAKDAVEKAKAVVEDAKTGVTDAKTGVEDARTALADAKTAVGDAERALEQAKTGVTDAKSAVETAKTGVTDAKTALEDARTAVSDAQKALDDARATSMVITAPFAGYVTKVNIAEGGNVQKGATVIEMLDPTKFEVNIMASEQDIFSIMAGGEATVQLEAMPMLSIPATVTRIAPTATIQQGVVNYSVKVDLDMARLQSQRMSGLTQAGQAQAGQGQFSPRQGQTGQLTPDEIRERMSQAQGQRPSSGTAPVQQPGAMVSLQLKEGLSATVTITILRKDDVLLVPSRAITRKSGQTTVQVLNNGVAETRAVGTGLSDFSNIEITEGLNEGEQVVIPVATSSSTTQQSQGQFRMVPGGGMFR